MFPPPFLDYLLCKRTSTFLSQDVKMCVEVLQTLQKETDALEEAERSLLDTQDCLDKQKDDLKLDKVKAEVSKN